MAVHDELVISAPSNAVPEHAARLADCMREAASAVLPGNYPVEVEVGRSYGDLAEPPVPEGVAV
jgi:DNA polymerase I-like protein with 3'-5' exonuclease and polymerase domains